MLQIRFRGYFQCRLATDSAEYDSPTGVNGWTYAYTQFGEPPLDRIIRFHDPVALRSQAPAIGVFVNEVIGTTLAPTAHPLVGARLELMGNPVFEGRNHLIAGDTEEPVSPMIMRLTQGGTVIERRSDYKVTSVVQRRPYMGKGLKPAPPELVAITGVSDMKSALAYRLSRKTLLESAKASTSDPNILGVLDARIQALTTFTSGAPVMTLTGVVPYSHQLLHAAVVNDAAGLAGGTIDTGTPWDVAYWFGGWDADTLVGYTMGEIRIPLIG